MDGITTAILPPLGKDQENIFPNIVELLDKNLLPLTLLYHKQIPAGTLDSFKKDFILTMCYMCACLCGGVCTYVSECWDLRRP